MQWAEIRKHYPQQWVLLEATQAHTEANKRILDQLAVLDTFPDSVLAMKRYAQVHHDSPNREYYVFHTGREQLDITERTWLGIREQHKRIAKAGGLRYGRHKR